MTAERSPGATARRFCLKMPNGPVPGNRESMLRRILIIILVVIIFILSSLGAERLFFGDSRSFMSELLTSPVQSLIKPEAQARNFFTIGVESDLGRFRENAALEQTLNAIDRSLTFGEKNISIRFLDRKTMATELSHGMIDLTITQSDLFATLAYEDAVKPLASLWSSEANGPNDSLSVAVIVSDKNPEIYTFADIVKGKNALLAKNPTSLSLLIFEDEMRRMGFDYRLVKNRVGFSSSASVNDVIDAVLKDPSVIGVIPSCEIERLSDREELDASALRVLNRQSTQNLKCQHSGREYPSLAIGYNPSIAADDLWKISTLLYSLRLPDSARWSVYDDYRSVYDMLYRLKRGPYDTTMGSSIERFYDEHRLPVVAFLFLAVAVLFYNLIVSFEVRKRTQALKRAMTERERIGRQQEETNAYIDRLERTGIVGQMSSMIAHELKQPLAAVSNYTRGLMRRLEKGGLDEGKLREILGEINANTVRAVEIVEHVQSYAKQHEIIRKVEDLRTIIGKTVATFEKSRRTTVPVRVRGIRKAYAEVDSWEVELALVNLLKNSADAFSELHPSMIDDQSEIVINLSDAKANWLITVTDNAKIVTKDVTDRFFKSMATTKTYGLGLGLSIVASLAERHGGRVWAEPNDPRGVVVFMELPKAPEDKMPEFKLTHKEDIDAV